MPSQWLRGRVIKDLPKGEKFEDWLVERIKEYTKHKVAIMRRNRLFDIIPLKEYIDHVNTYAPLINRTDICIWYDGRPQLGIELGIRKSFYFNPNTKPLYECKSWKDGRHVSVPLRDLNRYRQAQEKYPHVQHWIIIRVEKPSPFIAVSLNDWGQHSFKDCNQALIDNPNQSVACLLKTPHFNNFEDWAEFIKLPH